MTTASTIARFTPALPPQPLAHKEIHLWFFPQWEKTSDAARSAPVRGLLAAYLDRPVDTVRIERGEHGKPRLTGGELEFNLAHTGAALLLGISHDVVLGLDLAITEQDDFSAFLAQNNNSVKALIAELKQRAANVRAGGDLSGK